MTSLFKGRRPKKKFEADIFKITRYAGVLAVAATYFYHQFIATPEHMWVARIMSLSSSVLLLVYEFAIYRREMKRRKQEAEAKKHKTIREKISSSVSEELRKRGL